MPRGVYKRKKPERSSTQGLNTKSAIVLLKQATAEMGGRRSTRAELLTLLALKELTGD